MNTEQKPEAIRLADNITASGHTEREAFEAWWRENVSQGLAEIDHDYRYWALWQARAAFSVDHIAGTSKMVAPSNLKQLADSFPELNMANYWEDDVEALHNWSLEVVQAITTIGQEAESVVLPEPFAVYDGEKWYANEEAAICSCATMQELNIQKLQKVFTEQQVRELLEAQGMKP